jgi:hypothetical protein
MRVVVARDGLTRSGGADRASAQADCTERRPAVSGSAVPCSGGQAVEPRVHGTSTAPAVPTFGAVGVERRAALEQRLQTAGHPAPTTYAVAPVTAVAAGTHRSNAADPRGDGLRKSRRSQPTGSSGHQNFLDKDLFGAFGLPARLEQ